MTDLKEVTTQVIQALKPIAEKIGQGAEVLYRMAVKDAVITGVESFVYLGLILIVAGVWFLKILPYMSKKADAAGTYDSEWRVFSIMATVCILIFIGVAGCFNLSAGLHYCLNPEYMALKDLLRSVK